MIEINGECDNAKEELRLRRYVRRDFALDHREKLLFLVFPRLIRIIVPPLDFIVLKVQDVYDIVFCFASIRRRRRSV